MTPPSGSSKKQSKKKPAKPAKKTAAARKSSAESRRDSGKKRASSDQPLLCSFCGKSQVNVKKLIAGPGVYICNECLDLCFEILDEEGHEFPSLAGISLQSLESMGFVPVFNRRDFKVRNNHCFYLGPFGEPFDGIYADHVLAALTTEKVTAERADEIFSTDPIIEDIWAGINSATFVVADLTDKNPNVLYEVGMAHTIGKPVIIITQDVGDVPFDLRHRRCIEYEHTPRGCRSLEQQLSGTVRFLLHAQAP